MKQFKRKVKGKRESLFEYKIVDESELTKDEEEVKKKEDWALSLCGGDVYKKYFGKVYICENMPKDEIGVYDKAGDRLIVARRSLKDQSFYCTAVFLAGAEAKDGNLKHNVATILYYLLDELKKSEKMKPVKNICEIQNKIFLGK